MQVIKYTFVYTIVVAFLAALIVLRMCTSISWGSTLLTDPFPQLLCSGIISPLTVRFAGASKDIILPIHLYATFCYYSRRLLYISCTSAIVCNTTNTVQDVNLWTDVSLELESNGY